MAAFASCALGHRILLISYSPQRLETSGALCTVAQLRQLERGHGVSCWIFWGGFEVLTLQSFQQSKLDSKLYHARGVSNHTTKLDKKKLKAEVINTYNCRMRNLTVSTLWFQGTPCQCTVLSLAESLLISTGSNRKPNFRSMSFSYPGPNRSLGKIRINCQLHHCIQSLENRLQEQTECSGSWKIKGCHLLNCSPFQIQSSWQARIVITPSQTGFWLSHVKLCALPTLDQFTLSRGMMKPEWFNLDQMRTQTGLIGKGTQDPSAVK